MTRFACLLLLCLAGLAQADARTDSARLVEQLGLRELLLAMEGVVPAAVAATCRAHRLEEADCKVLGSRASEALAGARLAERLADRLATRVPPETLAEAVAQLGAEPAAGLTTLQRTPLDTAQQQAFADYASRLQREPPRPARAAVLRALAGDSRLTRITLRVQNGLDDLLADTATRAFQRPAPLADRPGDRQAALEEGRRLRRQALDEAALARALFVFRFVPSEQLQAYGQQLRARAPRWVLEASEAALDDVLAEAGTALREALARPATP